jgi:hypothetical protein
MSKYHTYCECFALGDTAFNLCRANIGMCNGNYTSTIIHTAPNFYIHEGSSEIPIKEEILEIWNNCNFVDKVEIDINLFDQQTLCFSEKYKVPIQENFDTRNYNNVLDWVNLKQYLPVFPSFEKIAIFQPISLKYKPKKYLDHYIPIWNKSLRTLIENKFQIVMVGGEEDPIESCFEKGLLSDIHNKIGQWSLLESLSFLLYQADLVLSCDSWAAIWGIAARKRTFISWGYRMENNIDFWATGFLGNQDCYSYGWSSQKELCDTFLAESILNSMKNKEKYLGLIS